MKEKQQADVSNSILDEQPEHASYFDTERDIGGGQIRIGTSFKFMEDMYSLLFIG